MNGAYWTLDMDISVGIPDGFRLASAAVDTTFYMVRSPV
jgi:hypothetical protein